MFPAESVTMKSIGVGMAPADNLASGHVENEDDVRAASGGGHAGESSPATVAA